MVFILVTFSAVVGLVLYICFAPVRIRLCLTPRIYLHSEHDDSKWATELLMWQSTRASELAKHQNETANIQ